MKNMLAVRRDIADFFDECSEKQMRELLHRLYYGRSVALARFMWSIEDGYTLRANSKRNGGRSFLCAQNDDPKSFVVNDSDAINKVWRNLLSHLEETELRVHEMDARKKREETGLRVCEMDEFKPRKKMAVLYAAHGRKVIMTVRMMMVW